MGTPAWPILAQSESVHADYPAVTKGTEVSQFSAAMFGGGLRIAESMSPSSSAAVAKCLEVSG